MKDVVMILAYVRPEYLHLNLKHIATNPDFKDYFYLFVLDCGFRRQSLNVIDRWVKQHKVEYETLQIPTAKRGIAKQSYAVFEGYRKAHELAKEYVFMIEEDIIVSNQFFQWHKAMHKKEDLFCSIATRSHNIDVKPTIPKHYYTMSKYQSLGVCHKKGNLPLVLKHANGHYYNDPFGYVKRQFPNSKVPVGHAEQDGIFFRVIEQGNFKVGYSTIGFAQHSGLFGYNRKVKRVTGILQDKVKKLEAIIYKPETVKHYILNNNGTPYNVKECMPVNLNPQWNGELIEIQT